MRSYIELGCTPARESCVSVEPTGAYYGAMIEEVGKYVAMLKAKFSWAHESGLRFAVKTFPYDNGTYADAVVYYDDSTSRQVHLAYFIEDNLPERWTDAEVVAEPEEVKG